MQRLSFVTSLLAFSSIASAASRTLVAEPVDGVKIRVDGDLREWPAKMTELGETIKGSGLAARAVVGYDEKNLYLALRAADKRIARSAAAGEAEDHATLALAFSRGRGEYSTYEVEIYPGKPGKLPAVVKLRDKPVTGAKAVENLDDKELLIEAQIPWSTFPEAGKIRVGLRAAVSYTNADAPGSIKSIVSTSTGKSGKGLGALLLEAEQGLAELLRDKGLSDVPAREVYGNVSGDALWERVAVFGPYITVSGPRFRGGKEFYFAELGVSGPEMVKGLSLVDFDGDGNEEIVVKKRVGAADKYREILDVTKVGRDDAPFSAFAHEIGIKTPDGLIANKVKMDAGGIQISQGEAEGFEPESYSEPLAGNMPSALLPWESVGSRSFVWKGNTFAKTSEETTTPKLKGGKKAGRARASDNDTPRGPPAPRPPTSDELLDRVYALYKKDRGVSGGRPRFDFVTDVAGDSAPERVVIHDKDIVVFGKGFKNGTSFTFITIGANDAKDILDATARDLTGDGKAEVIVRAILRAKASKALGGDTVERHALLVYGIKDEGIVRIFGAETGRSVGKSQVLGAVAFEASDSGQRIELRPGRALGWTENSYPFPQDSTTAGGLEPLLLPWSGGKRSYKFNGSAYVAE